MKERPPVVSGRTYSYKTGCKTVYITINELDGAPFEIFITMGKAGGCAQAQLEALGRLLSWGLRSGADIKLIAKSLSGIRCSETDTEQGRYSCANAIAQAIITYTKEGNKSE